MQQNSGRYDHLTFNAPLSDSRADALARRLGKAQPRDVLHRGRQGAAERGLSDRIAFEQLAGAEITGEADLVLCIGSTHAYGEAPEALRALRDLARPGGRLLFGE